MAVAYDTSTESHTGTTGASGAASFTWNHTGGASARGALVFVFGVVANALPAVASVTYDGVTMTSIPYTAIDTDTEPGSVHAYYLDNCGTGTKAVVVNRSDSTPWSNVLYAVCYTVTAASATEVYLPGVETQAGSSAPQTAASSSGTGTGTLALLGIDDGSPGTNSLRFMGRYQGTSNVTAAGSGSTAGPSIDFGLYVIDTFYETTAGQGSRNVGGATITDDVAAIALAVREIPPVVSQPSAGALTLSGATPSVLTPRVVLPAAMGGNYASTILTDSPIGYWRLGEASGTVADNAQGTAALDGEYVGTPTLGATGALAGDSNTAVTLNGSTQWVQVINNALLDLGNGPLTIEAWIKRTTTGAGEHIILANGVNSYALTIGSSAADTVYFAKAGVALIVGSTVTIADTNWHYLVATKSGTTSKLYIDGVDRTGTVTDATLSDTIDYLYIGRETSGNYLNATVDEVAVYGSALTSTQVSAHYAAGTAPAGLTLTGATPTVAVNVLVQPTAASLTASGATPTVTSTSNVTSQPTAGALTATGATPTVAAAQTYVPTAAAATLSGATPTVAAGGTQSLQPTAASLTAAGATPQVSTPRVSQPTAASLTATPATPTVSTPVVTGPTAASMAATGATPIVAAAQAYAPTAASAILTGATPAVSAAQAYEPTAAAATLAGATPTVAAIGTYSGQPSAASLALAGATPTVAAGGTQSLQPTAAALTLGAATPAVVVTSPSAAVPSPAALTLTGATPTVAAAYQAAPSATALSLSGATPDVLTPTASIPTAASMALTGATPSVVAIGSVSAQPDAATLTLSSVPPDIEAIATAVAQPDAASLTLTGATPDLTTEAGISLSPTAVALYLAFATPAVAVTSNVWALPDPARLVLTGFVPIIAGAEAQRRRGGGIDDTSALQQQGAFLRRLEEDDEEIIIALLS